MPFVHWPLFDLTLVTPRVTLRLPNDVELSALADVAAAGIHSPASMPFELPWTDVPAPLLQRNFLQFHWGARAGFSLTSWSLDLAVFYEGRPLGVQSLMATDFATHRTVKTCSWLGRNAQGQGLGKEMRRAVLALAFDGLGAESALSNSFVDNRASRRVSEALGYEVFGEEIKSPRGEAALSTVFKLERSAWKPFNGYRIEGLEGCQEMFGA